MNSTAESPAILGVLLDRYRDSIEAHVAERDGGRFDIALTVGGLEIGYINLLSDKPFGVFRGFAGVVMASGEDGLVPLPAAPQNPTIDHPT